MVVCTKKRVSSLENHDLELDLFMKKQIGRRNMPFQKMDKSAQQVCEVFNPNNPKSCQFGDKCSFRHIKTDKMIVCKHWLRALCKKGDDCEFLHQYSMDKMPTCYFYSNFQKCENKDCPFQHISPENRIPECPWYARGFCKHGPACKRRHVRKVMCLDYMIGFCPEGPDCEYEHPRFELPVSDQTMAVIQCHYCQKFGHKSNVCPDNPNAIPEENRTYDREFRSHIPRVRDPGARDAQARYQERQTKTGYRPNPNQQQNNNNSMDENSLMEGLGSEPPAKQMRMNQGAVNTGYVPGGAAGNQGFVPRSQNQNVPLAEITCFKCKQKGHYANRCPQRFNPHMNRPMAPAM